MHDSKAAPSLIEEIDAENLLADKAYDSEQISQTARDKKINPVIPRRSNSKQPNGEFDKHLYKARHQVENVFARLKQFRSVATRFDKLAGNYQATVSLACAFVWMKLNFSGPGL